MRSAAQTSRTTVWRGRPGAALVLAGGLALAAPSWSCAAPARTPLEQAVADPARSPAFVARDGERHPAEELAFFGVGPASRVVEILPGGGYWTEILAPLLHDGGRYTVALAQGGATEGARQESSRAERSFRAKLAADPGRYGAVGIVSMGQGRVELGPDGSADLVLTFRNLHNWIEDGTTDAVLAGFYRVLRPGGILGIEDHRGNTTAPQSPHAEDGYVRQATAIALAERAGFQLVGSSEIDANPRDTADWPKGVWTLPPTFALGDTDRARYAAVGEADNFVLKFRKP